MALRDPRNHLVQSSLKDKTPYTFPQWHNTNSYSKQQRKWYKITLYSFTLA